MPSIGRVQTGSRALLGAAFLFSFLGAPPAPSTAGAQEVAPTPAAVAPAVLLEQTRTALRSDDPEERRVALVHYLRAVEDADRKAAPADKQKTATEMVRPLKPELLRATADSAAGINLVAAKLCRDLPGDADVVAALSKLGTSRYRDVRYVALASLAEIGDASPAAHAFALELLRSDDPARFAGGAYLAGRWKMIDAVPLLIPPLERGNLIQIRDAAAALGHIGANAESALPALRNAIRTIDAMKVTPPRPATGDAYREGELPSDLPETREVVKDAIGRIESAPLLR